MTQKLGLFFCLRKLYTYSLIFVFGGFLVFPLINQNKSFALYLSSDLDNKFIQKNNYNPEYILGAGDQIYIDFGGLNIYSKRYVINPDGFLNLPEINRYSAEGKTLPELEKELLIKYEEFLVNPIIKLNIYKHRPVFVYISGEVKQPGLYKLDYLNLDEPQGDFNFRFNSKAAIAPKLFNALQQTGGLSLNADLTNLEIIRQNPKSNGGGKLKAEINLLSMITEGDQSQNVRLFDGDIIKIKKSNKPLQEQILALNKSNITPNSINVYITGYSNQKGALTLKKGATLNHAISISGGKKIWTGNIEFIRFNNDSSTTKYKFAYDPEAKPGTKKNPILMEGDIVNINKTFFGQTAGVLQEVALPIVAINSIMDIFQ